MAGTGRVIRSRVEFLIADFMSTDYFCASVYTGVYTLGSRVVSMLDSGAEGPGFKS